MSKQTQTMTRLQISIQSGQRRLCRLKPIEIGERWAQPKQSSSEHPVKNIAAETSAVCSVL